MNEPLPPLSSDQVDELLSAELDGEFDAAASELGFDPERASALLAATDGVPARRHALARARAAMADVPPLDELTETRLRTAALAAAAESGDDTSRVRRWRAWLGVASVAATLVVILGGVGIVSHSSSDSGQKSTTAAGANPNPRIIPAGPTSSPSHSSIGAAGSANFGTVSDAAALQKRVATKLQEQQHADTAIFDSGVAAVPNSGEILNGSDSLSFAALPTAAAYCDASARKAVKVGSPLVLAGRATLARKPVTVFVYRNGTQYVLVASDSGCKVVARRVFPR